MIDKKGSALTREEAARFLGAHLCRCTGYTKILDAVEVFASGKTPEVHMPGGIGTRGVRYQGTELALGDRGYVDDINVPGMLHAALRLSDHARAEVLRIDTAAAEAMPGVEAVFTAADVPGDLRVGIIHTDWPVFIPEGRTDVLSRRRPRDRRGRLAQEAQGGRQARRGLLQAAAPAHRRLAAL